jgi:hypothetical protein
MDFVREPAQRHFDDVNGPRDAADVLIGVKKARGGRWADGTGITGAGECGGEEEGDQGRTGPKARMEDGGWRMENEAPGKPKAKWQLRDSRPW